MAYHCRYIAVVGIYLTGLASSTASTNETGQEFYNLSRSTQIHVTCPADFQPVILNVRSVTQNIDKNTMSQMTAILNSHCWREPECHIDGNRIHTFFTAQKPENWELIVGIMCVHSRNVVTSCTQRVMIEGTGVILSHGYPYYSETDHYRANTTNCSVQLRAEGTIQLTTVACGQLAMSTCVTEICSPSRDVGKEYSVGPNLNIFYKLKPYGYKGFLFLYQVNGTATSSPTLTHGGLKQKKLVAVLVGALGIVVIGVTVLLAVCHIGRKRKRPHTSTEASIPKADNDYDYISLDRLADHATLSPSLPPPRNKSVTDTGAVSASHVSDDVPQRSEDGNDSETIKHTDVSQRLYHVLDASAVRLSTDAASVT